jgi:hypothetical protein
MKRTQSNNHTIPSARLLAILAFAAAFAETGEIHAQTWETVLDYQYLHDAGGGSIVTDPAGQSIFAGGVGYPASGFGSGLVLWTDATEGSWYPSDNSNPSPPRDGSEVNGRVAVAPDGNCFVAFRTDTRDLGLVK